MGNYFQILYENSLKRSAAYGEGNGQGENFLRDDTHFEFLEMGCLTWCRRLVRKGRNKVT